MQKVTGSTPVTSTKPQYFLTWFYVYIIYSEKLDKYYVGYTVDISKRIGEHNSGISTYTAKANDWILKYSEYFPDRGTAIAREREIKKMKSRTYIEHLTETNK